jgi:glycosyltransferase involved in cell wall biosynthesis
MISQKRRLAVISTHPPKDSGLGQYTIDLINSLPIKKYFDDIHMFSVNINKNNKRKLSEIDLTNIQDLVSTSKKINKDYDVASIQFDEYYFHNNDLIELNYLNFYTFLSSITIPVVVTLHFCFRNKRFFNKILKSILCLPNVHIVVHSKNHKKYIQNITNSSGNIHLIHHGYPDDITKFSSREKLTYKKFRNENENNTILMTLGYFGEWKNQLNTIKLVADLIEDGIKIRYYVIGSDVYGKDYYLQCKKEIESRRLTKYIILKNEYLSRERFNLYMKCTDIYIAYHKNYENLNPSGTLIYALGAGTPVITSRTMFSSSPEIKDLSVLAKDDAEFTFRLNDLITDGNKRKLLSRKSIDSTGQWAWSKISQKYLKLIQKILYDNTKFPISNKLLLIYPFVNSSQKMTFSDEAKKIVVNIPIFNLPFSSLINTVFFRKANRIFQYTQLYTYLEIQTIWNKIIHN